MTSPFSMARTRNWRAVLTGVVFVIVLIVLPIAIRSMYWQHVLIMIVVNVVLGLCFTVSLKAGMVNVTLAAFWGIGAYATAVLMTKAHMSFWLALLAAVVICLIVSVALGIGVVRFLGFAFVIVGLVIASVVPLIFGTFNFFGRYTGILDIPSPGSLFTGKLPFYYLVLGLALVSVVVMWAFYSSSIGRAWRALGLSEDLAQSVGVHPRRYRLISYALSATVAGLMGSFYATYSGTIVPGTFGAVKALWICVPLLLGGTAYVFWGPIVGGIIVVMLPEVLRFTGANEPIITGVIVILVIMFLPQGVLGLFGSGKDGNEPRLVRRIRVLMPRRGLPADAEELQSSGELQQAGKDLSGGGAGQ